MQTADYARAIMGQLVTFHRIPNDVEQAVAARVSRQQVIYDATRRFALLSVCLVACSPHRLRPGYPCPGPSQSVQRSVLLRDE
ncbi:DUF5753 domain-containing protein [Streptomyces formicae]|uniref:DUF5753 domain-containing protein n=1 Tax=Streptomyces formicae TaxID=1616117 RepID=UPI001F59F13D|nr:DUF5753 domain-containing protein [Streptomyces formicae]